MDEIKRVPLNKSLDKKDILTISKKDFLIGLGISNLVVDKLLKIEQEASFCLINLYCTNNCIINSSSKGIKIEYLNSLIDKNILATNDFDKNLLTKIRK